MYNKQCLSCSLPHFWLAICVAYLQAFFATEKSKVTDKFVDIAEMSLQTVIFKYNSPFLTFKCPPPLSLSLSVQQWRGNHTSPFAESIFRNNKNVLRPLIGLKYGETEIEPNFSAISEYLAIQRTRADFVT